MPEGLDPLKQELFSYLERLPESYRTTIRARPVAIIAGFGEHLNTLYGGDWTKATEDFQFYQFVKTGEKYLDAKSPVARQRHEKKLVRSAMDAAGLWLDGLLDTIFPKLGTYQSHLATIEAYIRQSPPTYDEGYRVGLVKVLQPPKLGEGGDEEGLKLLKEQVDEVLSTLDDRERKVLQLRFGLDDGRSRSLSEVGEAIGRSKSTAKRIEAQALYKLRHPSRRMSIKDFIE